MSSVPPISDGSIDDHVRGRQIHRMEQSVIGCLWGFQSGTLLTCVLFWQEWAGILLPWAAAVLLASGTRLTLAYRISSAPPVPCGREDVRRYDVLDVAISVAMLSGVLWIMFYSVGLTALYMAIATASILWAGALVYISVFRKAATFILTQMLVWITMVSWIGWSNGHANIIAAILVIGVVALTVCYRVSTWLKDGLRQQVRLEAQTVELLRQTETIGLLLREHESETSDWLWQADASLEVHGASTRFASVFHLNAGDLEGLSLPGLLAAPGIDGNAEACRALQDLMEAGLPFRDAIVPGRVDGLERWWSVSGRPVLDAEGRRAGYRGVMTDVTAEQQASTRISHLAHYDPLTDLPNRIYFLQRLETKLAGLGEARLAIIYLDLDGFKLVNDRFGHAVGDALLVAVGRRLQDATSNHDLVARLSGDEFVIKTRFTDHGALEALCKRLLKGLSQPYQIEGHDITVGASLGVALAPEDGTSAAMLLKNADAALYRAKRDGRGTYRFFASELDQELQERADLLQDLHLALNREELVLHYQPFVDVVTGAVTGYEALIRWQHPQRGLISPLNFVPLAEDSGLIVPIGAWVIRTACAEAATWSDDRRVSVNISPVQFHDRDLPERILAALAETGLPAHRLEIELTESIFVSHIDQALCMLRQIRALGVRVALDDFGTGYSSLSYLQSFPFDKIKIDRAFVRDLGTRSDSQVIVRAVGDIARGLNMTVTAEGVETQDQVMLLQTAGCHELQGYLYGRPTPPSGLASMTAEAGGVWERARHAVTERSAA